MHMSAECIAHGTTSCFTLLFYFSFRNDFGIRYMAILFIWNVCTFYRNESQLFHINMHFSSGVSIVVVMVMAVNSVRITCCRSLSFILYFSFVIYGFKLCLSFFHFYFFDRRFKISRISEINHPALHHCNTVL